MVFDIQRFSTHDGPGVRTVVFFKGCPLRCPWCENPESQSRRAEIFYDARICLGCLDCTRSAVGDGIVARKVASGNEGEVIRPFIRRDRLRSLDTLRGVCPTGALTVVGRKMKVDEIMREVEKDRPFYGSTGGLTVSGGEPFVQPGLLAELSKRAAATGIGVAVETSLQVPWSSIEPVLPAVSLFLADLKHTDGERYRSVVGGRLSTVLENFRKLEKAKKRVIVRVPVVPGFNDDPKVIGSMLELAASMSNVDEVHLLPYHTLGAGKYELLGRDYEMNATESLAPELLAGYADKASTLGLQLEIGG